MFKFLKECILDEGNMLNILTVEYHGLCLSLILTATWTLVSYDVLSQHWPRLYYPQGLFLIGGSKS